jgi:hypothetical protein
MADQKKGDGGQGGEPEGGKPKGWRSLRDAEGGENSGFERALQPDVLSEGITCLIGLVGQSTREGYRVLFLSLDMNSRVEIRDEDIVYSEKLSPEESPFGSLGGTRICVKKGADLDYTRTTARKVQAEELAGDEFDLDIRLGRGGGVRALREARDTFGATCDAQCPGPTRDENTCFTCQTRCGDTCFRTCRDTCRTNCATCVDTCPRTQCDTCPRTACDTCRTCDTCRRTQCETCVTCATQCDTCPRTACNTCNTCLTLCGTCRQTECGDTCLTCATQCDTCIRTECDTCLRTECGPVCGNTRPITICNCV